MTSANSTWFFLDKQGDFDSASFTASWHESTSGIWGNLEIDGTMLITVDYSRQTAGFTVTENTLDRDTDCTGELIITGSDIPFFQQDYRDLSFLAIGSVHRSGAIPPNSVASGNPAQRVKDRYQTNSL